MKFQNTSTLQSGHEYTLANLFSGDNKIIIPDLQRDYCWGNRAWNKDAEKYTELVSGFLNDLITSYEEDLDKEVLLGLIYGYESPKFHIQLCDGQQRITTLYLILGIVNRKSNGQFQNFLISEAELIEDKEPYLQYAIRESTLYFLSDLVSNYFLKSEKDISFKEIKHASWHFLEYKLDASIGSMLAAIASIEDVFDRLTNFDFVKFGRFLLNDLQMLYYDMGNRTRGEETFVIINTTGEPLSAAENLKPIIIGNITDDFLRKKASDEWEIREEWFWQHKSKDEFTSDEGVNQFFVWYWQLRLLQEKTWKTKVSYSLNPRELFAKKPRIDEESDDNPEIERWAESIKTDTVHHYFCALKTLIEQCKDEVIINVLKTIKNEEITVSWFRNSDLHVILPLIAYLVKFPDAKLFYAFIRRIRKNYFDEKRKRGNFVDWRYIIQIIELSHTEEDVFIFSTTANEATGIKKISNIELSEWYGVDEQNKHVLKKQYQNELEHWEDHIDLMGNLSPIWLANADRENAYTKVKDIYDNFVLLYNCYIEGESENHPMLSNFYRLYRVLLEENVRIGHIPRSSGMKGAWFSWINANDDDYLKYLNNSEFLSLLQLKPDQLVDEIKERIKLLLPKTEWNYIEDNITAEGHLKRWLLLKALQAEKNNLLLHFYDGHGIASYIDCFKNKLNKDLPFSLSNSICGYGIKSGASSGNEVRYAINCWGDQRCFDTLIGDHVSLIEFQGREESPISQEAITTIDSEIQVLLDRFYS
ncbi:DUF262 domain-containing protein [Sphingobacterium faecium]